MFAENEIKFLCQYCGYENSAWIDLSKSGKQEFVEDCSVCRNANRIIVTIDQQGNINIESRIVTW